MIRLIWDFFGPDAPGLARHHAIHLREFMERDGIDVDTYGQGSEVEGHCASWCDVAPHEAARVARVLKPQRQGDAAAFEANAPMRSLETTNES